MWDSKIYVLKSGYVGLENKKVWEPLIKSMITDSVRLTTAFGSDRPVVSRSGRKSNLIYTCMYI